MQKAHKSKPKKMNAVMEPHSFDVAIIGGGPVGCTLSCLLAKSGLSIACIDQINPNTHLTQGHDGRTTAISYGSSEILEKAGVWQTLKKDGCAIQDIQILDSGSPALLGFLVGDVGASAFGWIFENRHLRRALFDEMATQKTIAHITPAFVTDYKLQDTHVDVFFQDGRPAIKARLVIGCDGRSSFTREWMGIGTRGWPYHQTAIVCTVRHEYPHHHIAVEDFRPEGPFAILPMTDDAAGNHRSSLVWTIHGHGRTLPTEWDDLSFNAALETRFPAFYGRVQKIGAAYSYPLGLIHAHRFTGTRMALVGDAAHGIHPIAGQGLNMGLRDTDVLARLILGAHHRGQDIGAPALLSQYESERRVDTMAMVAVTDQLNALFSNQNPLLRTARRTGLRMVQCIKPARLFFMRQAMGLSFADQSKKEYNHRP